MNTNENSSALKTRKMILSTLWIFIMFNYLYCDLISNMESSVLKGYLEGHVGSIQVNQEFMLGAALLMEIPIVMILLSRILKYRANRWANIIAGTIHDCGPNLIIFFWHTTNASLHILFCHRGRLRSIHRLVCLEMAQPGKQLCGIQSNTSIALTRFVLVRATNNLRRKNEFNK